MEAMAAIFDGYHEPVLLYHGHRVLYANPAFALAYGARSLKPAHFPAILEELDRAFMAAGSEIRLLHSEPEKRFAIHSRRTIVLKGVQATLVMLRNIAEVRELRAEVLRVSRRENDRIAGELHDGVGQELAGIALQLEPVIHSLQAHRAPEAEAAAAILDAVLAVGQSVRKMAHALAPAVERQTLGVLLRKLSVDTSSSSEVSCICRIQHDPPLPPEAILNLHRIAREAVTNARRHGRAREIVITLEVFGQDCILTVKDNGAGLPEAVTGSGIGLRLMNYRVAEINGRLTMDNLPTGGTLVQCTVPLTSTAEAPLDGEPLLQPSATGG